MIGLAALSATHWLRDHVAEPGPVLALALGVMPNLAAAFAMPLILASFTPRASRAPVTKASRLAFGLIACFTTLGLCGWELVQTRSDRFVFDVNDLLATGLGTVLAGLVYAALARRFQQHRPAAMRPDH